MFLGNPVDCLAIKEVMKLKVIHFTVSYMGAQRKIIDSIHYSLCERGYESIICYCVSDNYINSASAIRCLHSRLSLFIFRILNKLFKKNYKNAMLPTKKLIRMIEKEQPNIVHLHVIHNGLIDYVKLIKYLATKRIKIVWTMHDMWVFTGGCYHFSDISCNKYMTGCDDCQKDRRMLDNPVQKTSYYWHLKKSLISDLWRVHFVAVSKWVKEQMSKSFLKNYPTDIIYNGLSFQEHDYFDIDMDKRLSWKKNNDIFILVAVANSWGEDKGLSSALALADALGKEYHIILVGAYTSQLAVIPSHLHFWGYEPDAKVLRSLYHMADLHISFSVEETFGMTFLEAAVCGTRSLGFDATAIGEVIRQIYGYVVSPGSIKEMEAIIRKCCNERASIKLKPIEISEIREKFSIERMVNSYFELYNQILFH